MNNEIYAGMDARKETVFIVGYKDAEQIPSIVVQKKNREYELRKYFKKLQQKGELLCCYETGFSGFSTYRMLGPTNGTPTCLPVIYGPDS